MPRSAASALFVEDEPILKFEESKHSPNGNSGPAHLSLVDQSPEDDPYSSLKTKQEQLLRLRQDLERTERETSRLEAQRQKEERFSAGRSEMMETFSRSLVRLERDLYNSQKAIEDITTARDLYQRHLDHLRAIHPESWQRANLDAELDRAIAAIEDAEDEYNKTSRRLSASMPGEAETVRQTAAPSPLPKDFKSWLLAGLAFTLPLMGAFLIWHLIARFIP